MPDDVTLSPPHSPEPNPVEDAWACRRQNRLGPQACDGRPAMVEACCQAWSRFLAGPELVRSVTSRSRAKINA